MCRTDFFFILVNLISCSIALIHTIPLIYIYMMSHLSSLVEVIYVFQVLFPAEAKMSKYIIAEKYKSKDSFSVISKVNELYRLESLS